MLQLLLDAEFVVDGYRIVSHRPGSDEAGAPVFVNLDFFVLIGFRALLHAFLDQFHFINITRVFLPEENLNYVQEGRLRRQILLLFGELVVLQGAAGALFPVGITGEAVTPAFDAFLLIGVVKEAAPAAGAPILPAAETIGDFALVALLTVARVVLSALETFIPRADFAVLRALFAPIVLDVIAQIAVVAVELAVVLVLIARLAVAHLGLAFPAPALLEVKIVGAVVALAVFP